MDPFLEPLPLLLVLLPCHEELGADTGTDLYVVFVSSFDGADQGEWAQATAELSQLGEEDAPG